MNYNLLPTTYYPTTGGESEKKLYFCKNQCTMIIEKRNKEYIIRIPETVDTEEIQDFVDYIRYKELTSKAKKIDQSVVDQLTEEININWWNENRSRLLND